MYHICPFIWCWYIFLKPQSDGEVETELVKSFDLVFEQEYRHRMFAKLGFDLNSFVSCATTTSSLDASLHDTFIREIDALLLNLLRVMETTGKLMQDVY